MPRLSVDIDLTYVPFSESRENDLKNIQVTLDRIKDQLKKLIPGITFPDAKRVGEELKIICYTPNATVKIEVNQINRGLIADAETVLLCEKAQEEFDRFCEIKMVSRKQLWGGKIVAALDRQHPRDIFDVRNLMLDSGISEEIKNGFLFFLLCSKRPIHEILCPNLIEQSTIFESQFTGMTTKQFSYEEFESTRQQLVAIVNEILTPEDKEFLIAFSKGEPLWDRVDYSTYPAIRWKLQNILKLKDENYAKYTEQCELLSLCLFNSQ